MFSLICVWINEWVNNLEAGDLRRHRGHYEVTVMLRASSWWQHDMHTISALLALCAGNPSFASLMRITASLVHGHQQNAVVYQSAYYHKTSNISAPNPKTYMFLISSCSCLCPIQLSKVLSQEWRCNWSSTDRQCSNYIGMISNYIGYHSPLYIRGLTVITVYELFLRSWFIIVFLL